MDFLLALLKGVGTLLLVILVFNLMIVVHELGHFWAAKWRGLKVEKFQIWFGNALLRWKDKDGVEWGLGSIPAGGFVKLPQMAPMEMLEGASQFDDPLKPISPLDKIIVAFAGPLFSILLAFAFACVVTLTGIPKNMVESTVIGYVQEDSAAEEAGLQAGDRIVSVNGTEVVSFSGMIDSVMERIALSQGDEIEFVVERPGEAGLVTIQSGFKIPEKSALLRPGVRQVGIASAVPAVVGKVYPDSPASRAGLLPGDEVMTMGGEPVYHVVTIEAQSQKDGGATIQIRRPKEGEGDGYSEFETTLTAAVPIQPDGQVAMTGVEWDGSGAFSREIVHPSPIKQVTNGLTLMWRTISTVVSPDSDVSARHMSGPIGIGNLYYNLISQAGWREVLWFSVILNVNLAVLNMLPFPVLDGGHILMSILEWIRGRAVNIRILEYVQAGCAIALISFMLFVTWHDLSDIAMRVFSGDAEPPEEVVPIKFAPPDGAGGDPAPAQ